MFLCGVRQALIQWKVFIHNWDHNSLYLLDGVPLKDMSVLVVPLSARACQVSNLTGGKGSQLAKLVALRNQMPVEVSLRPFSKPWLRL